MTPQKKKKKMKGKGVRIPLSTVIMGVLILGLVVAQTQVEAKSCCPSTSARNCYNVCRLTGASRERCASLCGCKIVSGTCPPGYLHSISTLESSGAINDYCKLGCASSVCNTIGTHDDNSDVGEEVVNETVEHCHKACSEFCNKGVALATA